MNHPRRISPVAESLREYGRGVGGGFLFSIPLLYTMEVWWFGFTIGPARLLAGMGAAFLLLCAYNAYGGLRYDSGLAEILIDSVEELGIGLALSAVVLLLLGRIGPGMSAPEILGKTIVEGLFVAIGVSVGTAQLASDDAESGSPQARRKGVAGELAVAFCGAVLIAANVGPTEEVLVLAGSMTEWQLIGTIGLSILLAVTLMYFSRFAGSGRFAHARGTLMIAEGAVVTYAAAIGASAGILWFFGRFRGQSWEMALAECLVLALPGTLGAAAGRLLLR